MVQWARERRRTRRESTTREHWQLACDYRMTMSTDYHYRVLYEQAYESAELTCNLELIMQHQDAFLPALNHGRDCLLQVREPTREQNERASTAIAAAHLRGAFYTRTAECMTLAGVQITAGAEAEDSGARMVTQAEPLKGTEETAALEERSRAAARAKIAEWHRAELEQRPRRILYCAIAVGVIIIVAVALLVHGLP